MEEHTHEDTCYNASASDPTADLETYEEWENFVSDVILTGDKRYVVKGCNQSGAKL